MSSLRCRRRRRSNDSIIPRCRTFESNLSFLSVIALVILCCLSNDNKCSAFVVVPKPSVDSFFCSRGPFIDSYSSCSRKTSFVGRIELSAESTSAESLNADKETNIVYPSAAQKKQQQKQRPQQQQPQKRQLQQKRQRNNVWEYSYIKAINGFANKSNVTGADLLLKDMIDLYLKGDIEEVPTLNVFNKVLKAWSRSRYRNSPEKAIEVLDLMINLAYADDEDDRIEDVVPNVISYSAVMDCYAKVRRYNSGRMAESMLREMQDLAYRTDIDECNPDTVAYNSVINAYANTGDANKAEEILNEMYDEFYNNGNNRVKPDVQSFTTVLKAWSRSKAKYAMDRSNAILLRMRNLSNEKVLDVMPNTVSFNIVINFWAKSQRPESGEQAEAFLRTMQNLANAGRKESAPDTISYNAVINAYSGIGNVEKAEALLEEMYDVFSKNGGRVLNSNSNLIKPDVTSFTSVIKGWSMSKSKDAPERALSILNRMDDLSRRFILNAIPNTITYNVVMDVWARAGRQSSGERAEMMLRKMISMATEGRLYTRPNTISYTTVIKAYAIIGNAEKAEEILYEMYDVYRKKNNQNMLDGSSSSSVNIIRPNSRSFNAVLKAWSVSNDTKVAPERAESIIEFMRGNGNGNRTFETSAEKAATLKVPPTPAATLLTPVPPQIQQTVILPDVRPNMYSYSTLIEIWAKAQHYNSGKKAEAILRTMQTLASTNKKHSLPNTRTYNTVISAYTSIGDPNNAEMILNEMYDAYINGDKKVKPDAESVNTVYASWTKSNDMYAQDRARDLLKRFS